VTLSIHLNDSEVDAFEKRIPVELAEPPWNYSDALENGIQVHYVRLRRRVLSAPVEGRFTSQRVN